MPKLNTSSRELLSSLIKPLEESLFTGMGVIGVLLIIYGIISANPQNKWAILEAVAPWLATIVTLIGTLVTALSIYPQPHTRRADLHSRWVTAPVIIVGIMIAFGYLGYYRTQLPQLVVNGFAILGLAGSGFRLLPFSGWEPKSESESKANILEN